MIDFKFGDGQIIEYDILTERETKTLIGIVMDAVEGRVQIDYEMRGEWVQLKPRTIIDRVQLKRYNDGWAAVGLRQVKDKTPEITPPAGIVRHRRKAYRRVERALIKLFEHGIISHYTIRHNGYLWVQWFDGYIETERVSFEKWNVNHDRDAGVFSKQQMAADYLRDRIFLSSNEWRKNVVKV